MFGSDIAVMEMMCLINGEFNRFFCVWCQANFTKNDVISTTENIFDRLTNFCQIDAKIGENCPGDAITFTHKGEQEMFGSDIAMTKTLSFFLGEAQYFACPPCEAIKAISIIHVSAISVSIELNI